MVAKQRPAQTGVIVRNAHSHSVCVLATFDIPRSVASPTLRKGSTVPTPVKFNPGQHIDVGQFFGLSAEAAEALVRRSPDVQRLVRRNRLKVQFPAPRSVEALDVPPQAEAFEVPELQLEFADEALVTEPAVAEVVVEVAPLEEPSLAPIPEPTPPVVEVAAPREIPVEVAPSPISVAAPPPEPVSEPSMAWSRKDLVTFARVKKGLTISDDETKADILRRIREKR